MDELNRITGRDHYERPHARWVCGNLSAGCPCHLGPDARGRCQATSECTPVQSGEQWLCTRSTVAGGPCAAGPFPDGKCCRAVTGCVPVRTTRNKRRVFVTACTLLTLGFLMLGISGPRRDRFLSSGSLSSQHARLEDSQNCDACHAAAHEGAGSWFRRVVGVGMSGESVGAVQSDKCLACHAELFDGPWPHQAHNVDPERLAARTASFEGRAFRFRELFGGSVHDQHDLACAMCHREHHGATHDLEAMTNRQCQSCHAETFASLATGHPDFGDWPYRRRTRIAFNHLAHETKHFPQESVGFDCARCHIDDGSQTVKLLAGFDQACASCHNDSIRESFADGIPLLALPAIDPAMLPDQISEAIAWPEAASGFFDGTVPPLMQLLLAADESTLQAMNRLDPSLDFSLIDIDDPQQLQAAVDVAAGIRRLMEALQANGNDELQRRISVVLKREVRAEEISVLTRRTPPVLLAAVAQAWFPAPDQSDLTSYLQRPTPTTSPPDSRVLANSSPTSTSPTSTSPTNDGQPAMPIIPRANATVPARRASFARQDSELLAENPLRDWLEAELRSQTSPTEESIAANSPQQTQPARPTELEPENQADVTPGNSQGPTNTDASAPAPEVKIVTREVTKLLPSGDWQYDDLTMKLAYAPSGHADAMLVELLDLVSRTPEEDRTPVVQRVVQRLTEETGPGRCASCHTIDEQSMEASESADESETLHAWYVNWEGKTRSAEARTYTRFVHRPHLIQSETQDCSVCHALDRGYVFDESQRRTDPHIFHSEFLPLRKGTCASCHQPQGASDRCTTCHNYHVQSHAAGSTR